MQLLNELEAEPLQMEEEEKRHTRRLLVGLLCALVIAGIVTLIRGAVVAGIVLIIVGLLVGPGGVSIF